ncbi:hypothetical protein HMPREF9057_00632 [Actinomyces sp. oral taxon 171 str. F0337]|nr:hypothetical protein HMPREF9057_00632 [Actinomyces sp. oral taxon 171 str. F0337]
MFVDTVRRRPATEPGIAASAHRAPAWGPESHDGPRDRTDLSARSQPDTR